MTKENNCNNKNVENQIVRSASLLSLLALLIAVAIVIKPIFTGEGNSDREKMAIKAQSVAYQLMELEMKKNQTIAEQANGSKRGIASVEPAELMGHIGLDNKGKPFQYKVRNEGSRIVVDVWAEGDNSSRTQVVFPDPVR